VRKQEVFIMTDEIDDVVEGEVINEGRQEPVLDDRRRPPNRRRGRNLARYIIIAVAAVVIVGIAALVAIVLFGNNDGGNIAKASGAFDYNPDTMAPSTDEQEVVRDLLFKKGWKEEQLNFGDLVQHDEDRGAASFSHASLLIKQDLIGFINGDGKEATAVRHNLKSYLSEAGYGTAEVKRMLSGEGWVRVQFLVAFQWDGMTYYKNGAVVVGMSPRKVVAGDIGWFYVASNGKVLPGRTVVRSDCGNPALPPSAPPPGFKPPRLEPKDWRDIPDSPRTPPKESPSPKGTIDPMPDPPAPPDPVPPDTSDIDPPSGPAVPDSGTGATGATATPPPAPDPPAPEPDDPPNEGVVPPPP
jgi:hypothetical protein